jgi:CubicO group peptidase (beta-lactamase class C family)
VDQALPSNRDFSGVVLIAQGDQILVEKAYGKADFQQHVANQAGTRFRIASLSQTFTTAASTCAPFFSPGTDSHYRNEGYFLLALVIEKLARVPYAAFLQKNVFDPLKLANTGRACKKLPSGPNAAGNVRGAQAGTVVPLPSEEAAIMGPGSLHSTAHDLYAWLRAVDTNREFQLEHLEYPYGWGKRNYSGRDLIEQSGVHEGFDAHMTLYPKEHLYAVVLSNLQSGLVNRIPKDLEAILFGGETSRPVWVKPKAVGPVALAEYAGTYKASEIPLPQNLLVQDGQLRMQRGGYPFLRVLTPTAKDEFSFATNTPKCDLSGPGKDRQDGVAVGGE